MKLLGLFGLTCIMVALCYFCTTLPGLPGLLPRVVGWIGVGSFGLGFVALPIMFLRTGPQVVIDDNGIEDRRMKIGVIRWEDIRSLSIGSVNSARFLCIDVADTERYLSRLPRRSRWLVPVAEKLRLPKLTISFTGLSPGLEAVCAHLQTRVGTLTAWAPESQFVVHLSDTEVVCERPDGKIERVGWADLQKVEVVTTSDGPRAPDVFWVLHGAEGGCAIPQGATGDNQLLERLQALPGFDNGAVIEAMSSVADKRFLCWDRAAGR